MKDNAAIDDSVIDHYRSKFDWAGGKGLTEVIKPILTRHSTNTVNDSLAFRADLQKLGKLVTIRTRARLML